VSEPLSEAYKLALSTMNTSGSTPKCQPSRNSLVLAFLRHLIP
jgi:hypothetical protein